MHNTLQSKHPNLSVSKIPRGFCIDRMPDTNDVDKSYPGITILLHAIVMYVTILHKEDEGTYLRSIKIDTQK